jgi:hypothetical protein
VLLLSGCFTPEKLHFRWTKFRGAGQREGSGALSGKRERGAERRENPGKRRLDVAISL